jgi:hypothetical protein
MTGIIQPSLSGGELSPGLWGRVDIARYSTCLELAKNVIIQPYGGIKNRAGFEYLGNFESPTKKVRLIPFIYSEDQSLILEFGEYYIRFWVNGVLLRYTATINTWSNSTIYQSFGLTVLYNGVNYYNLSYGNLGHNPASSPTYWHPLTENIIEVPTPYKETELFEISFVQSADVVFLSHKTYPPKKLSRRNGYLFWSIESLDFVNGPFSILNEVIAKKLTISAITGSITVTNSSGSAFLSSANVGQLLYIESQNYIAPWQTNIIVMNNTILRSDGKNYKALNFGTTGTVKPVHTHGIWSDGGVNWEYLDSGFGIGLITYVDSGGIIATVTAISNFPTDLITNGSNLWSVCDWGGASGYPGSVCIHQQRLTFGGSPGFPETIWMSKTGQYNDFGTSDPQVDDDSVSVQFGANTVMVIRGLLSLSSLIVTTSGGVWILGTGDQDAVTPSNVGAKLQTFRGASKIDPLGIGKSALYIQDKGPLIRDLSYELQSNSYQAYDLTLMASHLFDGYTIFDWAWQESPFQTLWVVRSDGVLLSCVYVREQEVLGWAQHDVSGVVESVCVIPEGNEHSVYISALRTVNGSDVRYLERMASRFVDDITDAFFVDSGLKFDNTNLSSTTITFDNSGNWDETTTCLCTASAPIFNADEISDIGDQLVFALDDGRILRFTIEEYADTQNVGVRPNITIPVEYRAVPLTGWNWARDTFSLPHLIGETVAILADGHVYAVQIVDASGFVTLDPPATKASIGLPYQSDLKTLDPNLGQPETAMDKKKNVTQVRFMVRESRGFWAGRDFDHLYEAKTRNLDIYDQPPALQDGIVDISIACTWEPKGSICLRQAEPLPINWIALIPELQLGGK